MIIHDNAPQDRLINELYAWVCVDPRTNLEGIAAVMPGPNAPMQAVTSSLATARRMGVLYQALAKDTGKKFKLVKFGSRTTIEEIG